MSTAVASVAKKALVLLAHGAEEMEAVIAIDVLRRGGITVTVAGIDGPGPVKCSRDVNLVPDVSLVDVADADSYDMIILPGGLHGSKALAQSALVGELLRKQDKAGRFIAAICAAPTAFKAHGIGLGKRITSYPSVKDALIETEGQFVYCEDRVVRDGHLTTSRGPGTAFEFALALVEQLKGKEQADSVAKGLLIDT